LTAPVADSTATPMQRASEALAAVGLELHALGPKSYVVRRAPPRPAPAAEAPLEEVSVYASRYALEGRGLAEPRELSPSDIEMIPGSHDDSLRALHSLPGLAGNASARPYIRGSLSEDVLVRYDGIALVDPFHLKNFQSLISAIDPAAVERIEVFSGGFPVRYGTRSGGVIDLSAPTYESGHETRAAISLISAGLSSIGKSEQLPIEWLAAVRRSTLDLIDPVEDAFGKPQFSDSLGRLRWISENGAWTLGWLLLDDRLKFGNPDDEEQAAARYRDEYFWLARDHRFSDALQTRASVVITSAERARDGTLLSPGVASGNLAETRSFNGVELANDWTFKDDGNSSYSFGGTLAATHADYRYVRHSEFSPPIAAAFQRDATEDLRLIVRPSVLTYALYAANRRKWSSLEVEFGLRLDGQHYEVGGDHTQVSPRLNLRYDLSDQLRLYASAGRFTQAQHVEEWRVEEAQQQPDPAQVSFHSILGFEYRTAAATRWSVEVYSKRWTTVAPYFDSELDPLSLLPDLAPDRLRLVPHRSEASGLELSVRSPLSDRLTTFGTLTWSRVADAFPVGDILRSWDQPVSLTTGAEWTGAVASVSALLGWHTGWPRTPFRLSDDPQLLELGGRNSERWGNFFTLDLRGSWTWLMSKGDLSVVLDVTNSTNQQNPCCAVLETSARTQLLQSDVEHWLPTIVNLGFTFHWRDSH
jgi:hypothetical protein